MYDLEILVPAEGNLTQRFIDFKKWGIRNIGEYKVRLILAASHDNNESMFEGGWPEGIDVEFIKTPYKHVAQRIYYYYDSIIKPDTAKWYYRIDEDSMNDISGLMKNLESSFDHEREYYIVAETNWDIQDIEKELLTKLGFDHWFTNDAKPQHEHEVSITSNTAMKRILANNKVKEYFKMRKEIADGYGDHGLCFCARMEKIHPVIFQFLTIRPEISEFSEFGGRLNHIHWVGRDTTPSVMEWMDLISPKNEFDFVNNSYIWSNINGSDNKLIFLNSSHQIEEIQIYNNMKSNIGIWSANNEGKLIFYIKHRHDPLMTFEAISGLNKDVITYKCGDQTLRTGSLSALIKI